jgi:hypothetical protein
MSALDNTPDNKNFLSPLNFKFFIKKTPYTNFFIQKINLPGIRLVQVDTSNPFVKTPYAGDHIDFSTLNLNFKVDEDLKNYLEIHNWIIGLGFPENHDQYKDLSDKPIYTGDGIFSDMTLTILSSTKTPNYEITFVDAFPITLSDLYFNTIDNNVTFLNADATFKYTHYTITKL